MHISQVMVWVMYQECLFRCVDALETPNRYK